MNNTLASLFSTLAPTLASALLGPLGGVAVAAVAKICGIGDGKVESITKAFNDGKITPDQIAELRKLEMQYQKDEQELGFRYEELKFKDIADARDMQKEIKSHVPAWLTGIVTVGFFGVLGWMLYDPDVVNSPPLLIMLGQLSAGWAAVLGFWFGTTSGSQQKNALLAQSVPAK